MNSPSSKPTTKKNVNEDEELPFIIPCRTLSLTDPFQWLKLGWMDLMRAPKLSLIYGAGFVLAGYLLTFLFYSPGYLILLFSMLVSFVMIGPVVAFAFYDISRQLQKNRTATFEHTIAQMRRNLSNELIFAVMLVVVGLIWMRSAAMLHIFFPIEEDPAIKDLMVFYGIGSCVGAMFSAFVFSIAAFSLPMMMDRRVDVITACLTSFRAVMVNKGAMLVWASLIGGLCLLGFTPAYLGMIVVFPWIGLATWHGYQATILTKGVPEADYED